MNKVRALVSSTLNYGLVVSAFFVVPMASTLVADRVAPGQTWFVGGTAHAQLIEPADSPPEGRRVPGVSQGLIEELTEVQSIIEPDPEEFPDREPDFEQGMQMMQEIAQNMDEYNAFEKAQIHQYFAQIYHAQERTDKLIQSFESIVAQSPQIPSGLEANAYQTLGQLYMQEDRLDEALAAYKKWAQMVTKIGAEQYYLLSYLFYQMDNLDRALQHVNKAVSMTEAEGEVPEENWLVMQRALHYEREDNEAMLEVLTKLVRYYPKISYWDQLSSIYGILGREDDRLHSLETVYMMGGIDEERVLISLAAMFLDRDVPYKAAKILDKGIYEDEIIEPTADNLEMLANAWSLAHEAEKSLVEIEKAAEKSDEGDLFARLSAIYTLNERYQEAVEAGQEALDKGVERSDQVYLRIGTAYANMEQYDKALDALEEAAKDKRSQEAAEQWISYVSKEKKRQEEQRQAEEEAEESGEIPTFDTEPTAQPAG